MKGTGYNLELMQQVLPINDSKKSKHWESIYLVDLSTSLLKIADTRVKRNGWDSVVNICEADALKFRPSKNAKGTVDLITFSYSLTMIPDWFSAIEHALTLLRPGGVIAIVDFYVGRKYPSGDSVQHSWFRRTFWKTWFAFDNVRLSDDHRGFISSRDVEVLYSKEAVGKVPYIPFIKAPHYIMIAKKN